MGHLDTVHVRRVSMLAISAATLLLISASVMISFVPDLAFADSQELSATSSNCSPSTDATAPNETSDLFLKMIPSIATGLVTALIAFLLGRMTNRKKYKYERSSHVTQRKFDAESDALFSLSQMFYGWLDELEQAVGQQKGPDNLDCDKWRRMLCRTIGGAAPMLDYRDARGEESCGIAEKALAGGADERIADCNACTLCHIDATRSSTKPEEGLESNVADRILVHCASVGKQGPLSCSLLHHAELLLGRCIDLNNAIPRLGKNVKEDKSTNELKSKLSKAWVEYYLFVKHVQLRLESIEMGRRDKRWKSFKEKHYKWHICNSAKNDRKCGSSNRVSDKDSSENPG